MKLLDSNDYTSTRLFNPRIITIFAIGVCIGCFLTIMLYTHNLSAFIFGVIIFLLILNIIITFFKSLRSKLTIALSFSLITLISMLFPVFAVIKFENKPTYEGRSKVECVVLENIVIGDNYFKALCERVSINDERISGTVQLEIMCEDYSFLYDIKKGEGLKIFDARVANVSIITGDSINTFAYRNDIAYTVYANDIDVSRNDMSASFFSSARLKILDILYDNLPENYAHTAFTFLTGREAVSDASVKQLFRLAGLAHVVAVSGLHIMFLIMLINYLFKRIPINKNIFLVILSIILLFYSTLCGFSPSVIRALIMGLVYSFAKCRGLRSDGLINLSISAILIFVVKPLYIMDLSFILSYLSVLSIFGLAAPIKNLLEKLRVPSFISSPASVTVSATIGLIPIFSAVFHSINVWTILSNLLVVPISMVLFIALFIITILTLILPIMGWFFIVTRPLFFVLLGLTEAFASMKYAQFLLFGSFLSYSIYYLCLVFPNSYSLLKGKRRRIVSILSAALLVFTFIFSNIPNTFDKNTISLINSSSGNPCLITTENNNKILVYDKSNVKNIESFLLDNKIRNLDFIIATVDNYSKSDYENLSWLAVRFLVKELWLNNEFVLVCDYDLDSSGFEIKTYEFFYTSTKLIDAEHHFRSINSQGRQIGLEIVLGSKNFLILNDGVSQSKLDNSDFKERFLFALCTKTPSVTLSIADNHLIQMNTESYSLEF